MAHQWISVRVELLGGRGERFWPYPGRIFAVGPAHTFADLATAIDNAFARWDLSHLSLFTLADGRVVADVETIGEPASPALDVVPPAALDIEVAKVMATVEAGAQFRYVFDFGDGWTHCCTVDPGSIDPADVLGVIPPAPLAYWGWGTIPDQFDRSWAEDDGETLPPSKPQQAHAMLDHGWPGRVESSPVVDLGQLRVESPPAKPLPVDLEELSGLLEGDLVGNEGGFLDLQTGELIHAFMTDASMVGADEAIDVDAEPGRWLRVRCEGSRAGWEDMADFAVDVADTALGERLERAIEGKGAFRRFRDVITDAGLAQEWRDFSDERQMGRAREYLADQGIRATT